MIEQKQLPTAEPQLDLETIRKRYYEAQTEIAALTALLATYDEEIAKLTRQRDLAEAREDNAKTALMLLSAMVDRIRRQRQAQPTLYPQVLAFARLMQAKLNEKAYRDSEGHYPATNPKGIRGWKVCTIPWLFGQLQDELTELDSAIQKGCGIGWEAADIANFAMMIADNAGDLKPLSGPVAQPDIDHRQIDIEDQIQREGE